MLLEILLKEIIVVIIAFPINGCEKSQLIVPEISFWPSKGFGNQENSANEQFL